VIISVGFDITVKLLIRYLHATDTGENETVHQLFIDFKKACDSVRREVLYKIFTEFGLPMKHVRLIKMCLNETYCKVRIGKYLSDNFPIQNSLSPLFFKFALKYSIR
jgi:hypothetical protein